MYIRRRRATPGPNQVLRIICASSCLFFIPMDQFDDVLFGDRSGTSVIQGNIASGSATQFNVGGNMELKINPSK